MSNVATYRDFVIGVRRLDARKVAVTVDASPAGRLEKLATVVYPETEAAKLRDSFLASFAGQRIVGGRPMLTSREAFEIGHRLREVLFPKEVWLLFAASLAAVVRAGAGLRIRLSMDPPLMDLPWEYVCRPDRAATAGMSSFLLLDPSISMVRHAADASVKLSPIGERQRLAFVGTFWEGKKDAWEVGKEFALLKQALAPVAAYFRPDFTVASSVRALDAKGLAGAAIFHYAGHVDFDEDGRSFLVKELPTTRALSSR